MLCTQCGAQLPDGSRFCSKCGANLSTALQEVTPSVDGVQATEAPTPKRTNTKRIVIAAVIAAVLIIGVGGGIFAYLTFFAGTPIDEAHFPDERFRNYVTVSFDADGDGRLSEAEVIAVNTVDLSGITGVADVTGIAEFTELQSFNLGANTVASVDLSSNPQVTQVSTGNGRVESIQLPDGFNMQDGLDGAVDAEVSAGDVVVQAGEWTTDNGGKSGAIQRYNGVLYVGMLSLSDKQIETTETTPFFGATDHFHFANNKVYWTDYYHEMNNPAPISLYSANVDGSDKQTLAEDFESYFDFVVVDDYVFFEVEAEEMSPYGYVVTTTPLVYINTKTGERKELPSEVSRLVGSCENRIVVALSASSQGRPFASTLAFFDPETNELTPIPTSSFDTSEQKAYASSAGVLLASAQKTTLYSPDGLPLWSGKALSDFGENKAAYFGLFMDDGFYYLVYETDYSKHGFVIEKVDLVTNEHTFTNFSAPDLAAPDESSPSNDYATTLARDGDSLIISIKQSRSYYVGDTCLYRVSLEDGTATCLQTFPVT